MNNKTGFTIVEIIISITVLAIIVLLVTTNLTKVFEKSEEFSYDDYVNKIKSAADLYLTNNTTLLSELNNNKAYVKITLKELKDSGFIDGELINPNTKEKINENEEISISLDEAGLYKFTYPAVKISPYLKTTNKVLNYNSSFDCLADLDTINLGLIDANGNLVQNYFKNNSANITCKTTEIDTKKIGHHTVSYSYINQDGVTNSALRDFVVIDHVSPVVNNITHTPTSWTNSTVTINANIDDNESGIAAHAINLNNCGNFTIDAKKQISSAVNQNGTYYTCAKDVFGNITEKTIAISNIDKTAPNIVVNKSTNSYVTSLTITGTLTDSESRVVAYSINQSSNAGSVSWTNITATTSRNVTQTITSNGTYYVWAKDAVGNVSNRSITINNIGTLKRVTFSTGELSSRTYDGTYNTGTTIKAIHSITTNTGIVASSSFSGSRINYRLQNGSSYTGTDRTTCSYSAQYRAASYDETCTRYTCPSGGSLSGSRCTGSSWSGSGYNSYACRNNSWVSTYNSNEVRCDTGYTKTFSCGSRPTGSCTNGATRNVSCTGRCTWRGNYNATCTRTSGSYSCPSGYTRSGSSCYRCSSGDDLRGSTCYYSCTYQYTYYRYNVTIEYII